MKKQELHPYKMSVFSKIPLSIRIPFIKWWFAGAVYYFVGWGLPQFRGSALDTIVVSGVTFGLLNVIIVKFIIKELSPTPEIYNKHVSIRNNSIFRIPLNVLYGLVIATFIAATYDKSNKLLIDLFDLSKDRVVLPAEPILYGLFFIIYDRVWILFRNFVFRFKQS